MPMKFGIFWNCKMRGKSFQTIINGGDLYFMSEEAVGAFDEESSESFS